MDVVSHVALWKSWARAVGEELINVNYPVGNPTAAASAGPSGSSRWAHVQALPMIDELLRPISLGITVD